MSWRAASLAGTVLAALAACSPPQTAEMAPPASEAPAAPLEESFADRLASIHMLMIEAGAVMDDRAASRETHTLALALANDLQTEDAVLREAAARAISPYAVAEPAADKLVLLQGLETTGPASVDAAYLHIAAAALTDAVNLLTQYARDGDEPALRAYAEAALPRARERLASVTAARDVATAEAPPP
ncbi:MAG: DUF4142 domain-containing protein [Caulobacteraceae bacterium]